MPLLLSGIDFFDELAAGLPAASTFALSAALHAGMTALALAMFVVPHLASLLLEAPALVWAERRNRSRVLGLGLAGMGVALLVAALAPNVIVLAVGLCLYAPASGIACGLAQAALMDMNPDEREQRMADWALAGTLGDLAAPLVLWAVHAAGFGWRTALVITAGLLFAQALAFAGRRFPAAPKACGGPARAEGDGEEATSLGASLLAIAGNRQLLLWLVAVVLCGFMDEILSALVGVRIHAATGNTGDVVMALTAFTVGGAAALLAWRRLLDSFAPVRTLLVSCFGCAASYGGWLLLGPGWLSALMLLFTGAFAAAHYPIAQAQAYRTLPGRSMLVAAAGQLLAPCELLVPFALGWLADGFGARVALIALLLQPLGLLAVALAARSAPTRT